MSGALIVTADFAAADLAWLDALRRRYYPAERNRVPAHLTIFHALPPSSESELRRRLAEQARAPAPRARLTGLVDLGSGAAFRIISDDLDRIREKLAGALHGLLGAQDAGGWTPHVTIQNKVAPKVARELLNALRAEFEPRPVTIAGLGLHRYAGGPWEDVAAYRFRGLR